MVSSEMNKHRMSPSYNFDGDLVYHFPFDPAGAATQNELAAENKSGAHQALLEMPEAVVGFSAGSLTKLENEPQTERLAARRGTAVPVLLTFSSRSELVWRNLMTNLWPSEIEDYFLVNSRCMSPLKRTGSGLGEQSFRWLLKQFPQLRQRICY